MTGTNLQLPPLTMPEPSRVHVREGGNSMPTETRDLLRSAYRRIRAVDAQIKALNGEKSTTYDALRAAGLDPALVKKMLARSTLSPDQLKARDEREETLRLYLAVVEDLVAEEQAAAAAEPDAAD